MSVYICKCGFCFERAGAAEQCPDCGGMNIRFANDMETAEYRHNREETDRIYSQERNAETLSSKG